MSEHEILEAVQQIAESVGKPVGGAIFLKSSFDRLTGPTMDHAGAALQDIIKNPKSSHVVIKVAELLSVTRKRLGDRIHKPGQIPLRVARTVLLEAAYSENDIVIQYLGGVLASSRTRDGRDDRGVKIANVVTGLSSYQLRAHYLIYSTLSRLFFGTPRSFKRPYDQRSLQIGFLNKRFVEAMDMTESEWKNHQIWSHTFDGLIREHLLGDSGHGVSSHHNMLNAHPVQIVNGVDLVCQPTPLGAELFLWAFGHSDKDLDFIFRQNFEIEGMPDWIPDAKPIR